MNQGKVKLVIVDDHTVLRQGLCEMLEDLGAFTVIAQAGDGEELLKILETQKPDVILDFATLTGSMAVAVTDRMSGIIANRPELACKAIGAGTAAGERIVAFPYEEDMDSDLDSDIADIKQCTLEGGGDHMHATRFMGKFIENDLAWCHADLSSTNRKGGLGAVQSDVNGFGVGFGLEMLQRLIASEV